MKFIWQQKNVNFTVELKIVKVNKWLSKMMYDTMKKYILKFVLQSRVTQLNMLQYPWH